MKAIFYNESGPAGSVETGPDGRAVVSDELLTLLAETFITDDGETALTPEDGDRYVQALPLTFRAAPYFWAEVESAA